jgi:hypothetical protein
MEHLQESGSLGCVSAFMALMGSFLQYLYKANYVVESQM